MQSVPTLNKAKCACVVLLLLVEIDSSGVVWACSDLVVLCCFHQLAFICSHCVSVWTRPLINHPKLLLSQDGNEVKLITGFWTDHGHYLHFLSLPYLQIWMSLSLAYFVVHGFWRYCFQKCNCGESRPTWSSDVDYAVYITLNSHIN